MNWLLNVVPPLAVAMVLALLLVLLARYVLEPFHRSGLLALSGGSPARGSHSLETKPSHLAVRILLLLVASRLLIWLVALGGYLAAGRVAEFLHSAVDRWVRWDADHYITLARDWYVNEGDARLHIVFFPFYPLVVRLLSRLTGLDTTVVCFAVSNLCLFAAGWALYRMTESEWGRSAARRSLVFLMFAPTGLFFSLPFSESMFLALTLWSVWMARRRRFPLAVLFGALAANTRLLGLLTAVPVFYEGLVDVRERMDAARASKSANARDMARAVLFRFFTSCLIGVGFGAYLLLNRIVTGDPFTFLLYQRQHWSQSFGSLHNTLRYTMNNAFEYGDAALRLGTWIPQALSILLAIVLLLVTVRRISPGDGAYALLYIYIASAPTWLLSGTRYLGAMYTVYPMLTLLSGRRWAYWLLAGTSVLALAYITYHYAVVGTVL